MPVGPIGITKKAWQTGRTGQITVESCEMKDTQLSTTPGFKQQVLSQFEPDIAMALLQFGKSLRLIDADVLIFMARKSLCLYDVLVRLGVPPVEKCLVSDRILDMRLDQLRGKKVALIDDTLILGTTVANSKKFLLESGVASVEVHAFCIDDKWWCKELIKPDVVGLHLSDDRVMTFCTATVRAMSLLPRPYIVDFPISRPLKVAAEEAQCFLSNIEWRAYNISTHLQRAHAVSSLSFFPNADAQEQLADILGQDTYQLLDLIKVRGFARKQRDAYWLQIVPIVVLKPVHTDMLEPSLRRFLSRVENLENHQAEALITAVHTSKAKQRLLQYLFSCIVGHHFISRMKLSLKRQTKFSFDMQETDRHYGPWLHDAMLQLTNCTRLTPDTPGDKSSHYEQAALPSQIVSWALSSLPQHKEQSRGLSLFKSAEVTNLIPDFSEIFLSHYDRREIPARKQARTLGNKVLTAASEVKYRNRLEVGLPWQVIVDYLLSLHNMERTPEIEQAFSLVLDFCNDQGIAVPITCASEDVTYRAYRHGEDVKFTDAEVALAYEVTKGFLDAASLASIPKLKLEKLLVLLMKVGVAKNFLEPLLISTGGIQEVLRIGFYLRGAIPVLARGSKDRADRESWFSRYLVKRGVLIFSNGRYELGKQIEGNYRVTTAPDEAYELGSVIGLLSKAKKVPARKDAPLDDDAITLLASCGTPRHAAAAVQVELELFREWFEETGGSTLRHLHWSNVDAVENVYKKLVTSNGSYALNGVRLKYAGYKKSRPAQIIDDCANYLEERHGPLLKRKWTSYWKAAKVLEATAEKATFDPLLDKAARICWEATLYFFIIEICLSRYILIQSRAPQAADYFQLSLRKFNDYDESMKSTKLAPPESHGAIRHLLTRVNVPDIDMSLIVSTYNTALAKLGETIPNMTYRAEAMRPMIEEYGHLTGRRDYQFMLYYDIVDSTGTVAGRSGEDLSVYRNRVRSLKQFLNDGFRRIAQEALTASSEVYCWNGDRSSTNDCKHVFIGGTSAGLFLQQVINLLARALEAVLSMRLRIYVVPCNFVGTTAYRQEWDTEVSGDRFWEHWSRLVRAGKEFEKQVDAASSFLLVAVESLIEKFDPPQGWKWDNAHDATLSSEIELLVKSTKVRYGSLIPHSRILAARGSD